MASRAKRPLISVIITNYNYGSYVGQAIESVQSQTYKNLEIIIIDDGSTDDSDKVIKGYVKKNPKITYINQENKGVIETRNRGMELAKGEYLCCLDADDFFDPDYIEKNHRWMTEYGVDVVYPNWQLVGDRDDRIEFSEFDFREYQLQRIHIKPESLIRSAAIKNKDGSLKYGYLPETKRRANDWAYFISLAANDLRFKRAEDNYINYRIKEGSMGSRLTKAEESQIFYNYLVMFRERYGDKIVEPTEILTEIIRHLDSGLREAKNLTKDSDKIIRNLQRRIDFLEQEINKVYSSRSWKITRPIRYVSKVVSGARGG